jgi:hypothetical protein
MRSSRHSLDRGVYRALLLGCLWFVVGPVLSTVRGEEYPWLLLYPRNDSRDPGMCDEDEASSRDMISVFNQDEPLLHNAVVWRKGSIENLLSQQAPFCEFHFDAIKPVGFTAAEKSILIEYLKRGGFILFFIDTYPYTQDEFWKIKQWPVIDFLTLELPAADPDFTVGKVNDASPIFSVHYQTETADQIRHELEGNPNTPNRTVVSYKGRICCFVMGMYAYLEDDTWVPYSRPFPRDFSMVLKSYELIVNLYIYAILR